MNAPAEVKFFLYNDTNELKNVTSSPVLFFVDVVDGVWESRVKWIIALY